MSSGHTTPSGSISITEGTALLDARLVVLHELAHYLTLQRGQRSRRTWHGRRFWAKAWELYAVYGIPLDYAWGREAEYCGGGRWCPSLIRDALGHELHGQSSASGS
jgi:hypothetical protein